MEKRSLLDLLCTPDAQLAQQALDALDGDYEKWLIKRLNDPGRGRTDWKERGFAPIWTDFVRMVVEKSGLLFAQAEPRLEVRPAVGSTIDVPASERLQTMFEAFDWVEFFNNFDTIVRLMKTAMILLQWDPDKGRLVPSILTRANAYVEANTATGGDIEKVLVKLSDTCAPSIDPQTGQVSEDSEETYLRLFTKTYITDFVVNGKNEQRILSQVENPYGVIPVAVFHDTMAPRSTFWNQLPRDLLNMQETLAMHQTDVAWAASWVVRPSPVVSGGRLVAGDNLDSMSAQELYGQKTPRMTTGSGGVKFGPDRIIEVEPSVAGGTVTFDFKGPDPDLTGIDDIVQSWAATVARNWSVNIKATMHESNPRTSGRQLEVEEIDNLQLRQRRQKMMEGGFKRLFATLRSMVNVHAPGSFADNLELFIEFAYPSLPVNEESEAKMWALLIEKKLASRVQYMMVTKGLSRLQAVEEVKQIDEDLEIGAPAEVEAPPEEPAEQEALEQGSPDEL